MIADLQDSQHRQPELSDNGGDKSGGMEENGEEGAVEGEELTGFGSKYSNSGQSTLLSLRYDIIVIQ